MYHLYHLCELQKMQQTKQKNCVSTSTYKQYIHVFMYRRKVYRYYKDNIRNRIITARVCIVYIYAYLHVLYIYNTRYFSIGAPQIIPIQHEYYTALNECRQNDCLYDILPLYITSRLYYYTSYILL